jgi:hypothetical protein
MAVSEQRYTKTPAGSLRYEYDDKLAHDYILDKSMPLA